MLLVLNQKTPFCKYAAARLAQRLGGKCLREGFGSYSEGRAKVAGCPKQTPAALPPGAPAILIWGDGESHQMSNILNIPRSVKYVFDNHDDVLDGGAHPIYDSHNSFSQREGVLVRVCRRISSMPHFSVYGEGDGNGLLHASLDLDFLKGFPALPWMSTGTGSVGALLECAGGIASRYRLVRLDIGGYSEAGNPTPGEMAAIYDEFYAPLLEPLVERML